jgi:hypothetical protein
MSTFILPGDLDRVVIDCRQPFRVSDVCLACLHADGRLNLLTGAWESMLGFTQMELDGRALDSLLPGGPDALQRVLRRLLDPLSDDPVRVDVLTKSGAGRRLSVHRRFDPYEPSLYLACEPLDEARARMSLSSPSKSALSSA